MNRHSMIGLIGVGSAFALVGPVDAARVGRGQDGRCPCILAGEDLVPLSKQEQATLLAMREEEKLARDVYRAMHDRWQRPAFRRITAAEQRHMDVIGRLVRLYELTDPVTDNARGVFTNDEFREVYRQSLDTGSESLVAALKVGAEIEERDIADLREALAATEHPALERVYGNLERASHKHLRAFARQLARAGGEYQPRHLPPDEFARLAAAGPQPGSGRGAVDAPRRGRGMARRGGGCAGCDRDACCGERERGSGRGPCAQRARPAAGRSPSDRPCGPGGERPRAWGRDRGGRCGGCLGGPESRRWPAGPRADVPPRRPGGSGRCGLGRPAIAEQRCCCPDAQRCGGAGRAWRALRPGA
jgi:hypothetical protein